MENGFGIHRWPKPVLEDIEHYIKKTLVFNDKADKHLSIHGCRNFESTSFLSKKIKTHFLGGGTVRADCWKEFYIYMPVFHLGQILEELGVDFKIKTYMGSRPYCHPVCNFDTEFKNYIPKYIGRWDDGLLCVAPCQGHVKKPCIYKNGMRLIGIACDIYNFLYSYSHESVYIAFGRDKLTDALIKGISFPEALAFVSNYACTKLKVPAEVRNACGEGFYTPPKMEDKDIKCWFKNNEAYRLLPAYSTEPVEL